MQVYAVYAAALVLSMVLPHGFSRSARLASFLQAVPEAESVIEPAVYDMAGLLPSSTATQRVQVLWGAELLGLSFGRALCPSYSECLASLGPAPDPNGRPGAEQQEWLSVCSRLVLLASALSGPSFIA